MGRTTTIEVDDETVRIIMDRYRLRTTAEAVDLALRHLVGRLMSPEAILAEMHGAHLMGELPPDRGPRGLDDAV